MNTDKIKDWFFVFRPWSFTATLIPFLVALALVQPSHGMARWWIGLVSGILFQATVNLLNTWGDERSGVDKAPGTFLTTPQVQQGRISLRSVLFAALACASVAVILGLALCLYCDNGEWHVSIPLLAAGFIGLLGATNYTTGIKFKYYALGVPFVAFLMGPLEVLVAMCILRPSNAISCITPETALITIPTALLVCIIMHGNDMRDIPTDRIAGIKTPATLLGPKGSLITYWACHLIPYLVCSILTVGHGRIFLLPFMALPLTRRTLTIATRTYLSCPESPQWRGLERASGAIHTVFGILYAIAIYASK